MSPAVPAPIATEYIIKAAETDKDITVTGTKLKDIQSIQAIDDSGQAVPAITFTKLAGGTDESSKWKVTPGTDRATEKNYNLRLIYSSGKVLPVGKSGLTLKVEKK